jgi:hypothetical protein
MSNVFRLVIVSAVAIYGLWAPATLRAHDHLMHGDHNPRHGGYVLMYGEDLHYEVVLSRSGRVQLWLSGPMRDALPATRMSDVKVEMETAVGKREPVRMAVDPTGRYWQGQGRALKDRAATLHLAFIYGGRAADLSLPASVLLAAAESRSHSKTGP